jgi:hypothetical protein
MEEGGKEEREREEGEEGGHPVRWRRPNLGRYIGSSGRGCKSQRLYRRGRWLYQAEGTPASRRGKEEAARATATRFFFDGRMRGRVRFFWSCFHLFHLFLAEVV